MQNTTLLPSIPADASYSPNITPTVAFVQPRGHYAAELYTVSTYQSNHPGISKLHKQVFMTRYGFRRDLASESRDLVRWEKLLMRGVSQVNVVRDLFYILPNSLEI